MPRDFRKAARDREKDTTPLPFFLDFSKVLPGIPVNFLMCSWRFLERAEVPPRNHTALALFCEFLQEPTEHPGDFFAPLPADLYKMLRKT